METVSMRRNVPDHYKRLRQTGGSSRRVPDGAAPMERRARRRPGACWTCALPKTGHRVPARLTIAFTWVGASKIGYEFKLKEIDVYDKQ
jgi:hypothetical protein